MRIAPRIFMCLFFAVAVLGWCALSASPTCTADSDPNDCDMAIVVLNAANSLKPGMLRSDVERDFRSDGGLSFPDKATYTYSRCRYIKIDVEFKILDERTPFAAGDRI